MPTETTKARHEEKVSCQSWVEEDTIGLLSNEKEKILAPANWKRLFWISISYNVIITFSLFFFCSAKFLNNSKEFGTYEHGFDTDLQVVTPHIELQYQAFIGEIHLRSNGSFFRDKSSTMPRYVGEPDEEVDEAWNDLLSGLNLDINRTEARGIQDQTYMWEEEKVWFSGLDVFHSLHCLQRIYQSMHPEYYTNTFEHPSQPSRWDHVNHCIDHIRQSLQCHADLTPMNWEKLEDKLILRTSTPHTCRNFERIRQWARERKMVPKWSYINGDISIID